MRLLAIVIYLGLSSALVQAVPPEPEMIDVFTPKDGYPNYRIPTLVVTNKGTLIATTEGRQAYDDYSDNKLVCKRSTDSGRTWAKLQLIDDEGKATCNDTSTVVCRTTGRIISLYSVYGAGMTEYNVSAGYDGKVARHFMVFSDDDGVTWSKPTELTKIVKRPEAKASEFAPGMGIQLRRPPHAGRLLLPMWQKYRGGAWAMMAISDDNGATWRLGEDVTAYGPKEEKRGITESQVVELSDGRVLLTGRGWDGEKYRKKSYSSDGGQTWTRLTDCPELVDPHCMASLMRFSNPLDGRRSRLLFANPADAKKRVNGTIRLSYDEGETWPVSKVLVSGTYAYSCLVHSPDGTIGCIYENDHHNWQLTFARLTMGWLTDGKDDGKD